MLTTHWFSLLKGLTGIFASTRKRNPCSFVDQTNTPKLQEKILLELKLCLPWDKIAIFLRTYFSMARDGWLLQFFGMGKRNKDIHQEGKDIETVH